MAKRKVHDTDSGPGRSRPISSFNRPQGRLRPRQSILIVCEGSKTEPQYLNALKHSLKLSNVEVVIESSPPAPISIVDRAMKKVQEQHRLAKKDQAIEFDEVWCVFDTEEQHQKSTFAAAVSKADKSHIRLAVSNPSFEFWYLLHYTFTDQPFTNANEVIQRLKTYLPKYDKSICVYADICNSLEIAVDNAKRVLRNHPDKEKRFPNPSTQVHELVEKLRDMVRPYSH